MSVFDKKFLPYTLPIVVGLSAGVMAPMMSGMSTKRLAFGLIATALPAAAVISRSPKKLLTLLFFLLVPFKIEYFLFKLYATHIGGAGGLYLVPSDLPLAGLYLIWGYETMLRVKRSEYSWRIPLLALPFIAAGVISTINSSNHAWSAYEIIRWMRFFLIAFYLCCNVRRENLPFFLVSIGLSVGMQSALALAQFALKSHMGLTTLGLVGRGSEEVFVQELSQHSSIVRGAGTTGHPNILGSYLVMIVPVFLSIALSSWSRRWNLAALLFFLAGSCGIAITLSRGAFAAFVVSVAVVLIAHTFLRTISVKRLVRLTLLGLMGASVVLFAARGTIEKRMSFDMQQSIDFRAEYNRVAVDMFKDRPFIGVGINNFTIALEDYDPERAAQMDREEGVRAAVHNLYLLVATETGIIGLTALLFLVCGLCYAGLKGSFHGHGMARAVSIGAVAGVVGVMAHNLIEFTLLADVNLYALASVAALINSGRVGEGA